MDDFYNSLQKIEDFSLEMCEKGRFHLPVIIYHELFRYCYPIEPYSKFKHTNPKPFLNNYITKVYI